MKITNALLLSYGFKQIDHGDCPPYESWEKDDIEVWNFNRRYWLVDALDQAGIEVKFKTIGQLSAFFKACGRSLTPTDPACHCADNQGGGAKRGQPMDADAKDRLLTELESWANKLEKWSNGNGNYPDADECLRYFLASEKYREYCEQLWWYQECRRVRIWLTICHISPWHVSHDDIDRIEKEASLRVTMLGNELRNIHHDSK